jgi:hypothetical protein
MEQLPSLGDGGAGGERFPTLGDSIDDGGSLLQKMMGNGSLDGSPASDDDGERSPPQIMTENSSPPSHNNGEHSLLQTTMMRNTFRFSDIRDDGRALT